jgi:hypothetical protein
MRFFSRSTCPVLKIGTINSTVCHHLHHETGSFYRDSQVTTSFTQGARGAIYLITETDAASTTVRLEAAVDGKGLLLIDVDTRKPGIQRAMRHEIMPAELIAAIRAHGAELPGEHYADALIAAENRPFIPR